VKLVTNSSTAESVAAEMIASTPDETPTVTEVCKAIDVQRNVTNGYTTFNPNKTQLIVVP